MSQIAFAIDPDHDRGLQGGAFLLAFRATDVGVAEPAARRKSPMKNLLVIAALLLCAYWARPAKAWTEGETLDVSAVTVVVIAGEASSVHLSTASDALYLATMKGWRKGWLSFWYSSWSSDECRSGGTMRVEGSTLYVETGSSSWFGPSDCGYEIGINLHKGAAISIDQAAVQAQMTGDYTSIALASHAGDISLDGHATNVDVKGDAMRVRLDFETINQNETITIESKALDAYVGFADKTPISYTVTGTASYVDSTLANTPGAKPSVGIKGDFVHATIR
jgi:hypothetical protein